MRRRGLESSLGTLAMVVGAHGAWAVDRLPTEYSPPRDIAEQWAMVLVVLIILAAMVLIVSTLATRRGRLTELHSKWLLFVGVGLLPIPAILLSMAVGLEHSKGISFCNSCHTIRGPFSRRRSAFPPDRCWPDSDPSGRDSEPLRLGPILLQLLRTVLRCMGRCCTAMHLSAITP